MRNARSVDPGKPRESEDAARDLRTGRPRGGQRSTGTQNASDSVTTAPTNGQNRSIRGALAWAGAPHFPIANNFVPVRT